MTKKFFTSVIFAILFAACMTTAACAPVASLALTDAAFIEPLVKSEYTNVSIKNIVDTHTLWLVNAQSVLVEERDVCTVISAYKTVPLLTADIQAEERALQAANAWFADGKAQGYAQLMVTSGYRSFEQQSRLYEDAEDKSGVQTPGASEHQTGLALDITSKGITGGKLAESKEGKWLYKTSWEHGFILRYPSNKTDITGIKFEPWHYRYVGLPHAYYCYEHDMCLEEYVDFLRDGGGYTLTVDGVKYSVYYAKPDGDSIKVPRGKPYEVSSDHSGGYIVTVTN